MEATLVSLKPDAPAFTPSEPEPFAQDHFVDIAPVVVPRDITSINNPLESFPPIFRTEQYHQRDVRLQAEQHFTTGLALNTYQHSFGQSLNLEPPQQVSYPFDSLYPTQQFHYTQHPYSQPASDGLVRHHPQQQGQNNGLQHSTAPIHPTLPAFSGVSSNVLHVPVDHQFLPGPGPLPPTSAYWGLPTPGLPAYTNSSYSSTQLYHAELVGMGGQMPYNLPGQHTNFNYGGQVHDYNNAFGHQPNWNASPYGSFAYNNTTHAWAKNKNKNSNKKNKYKKKKPGAQHSAKNHNGVKSEEQAYSRGWEIRIDPAILHAQEKAQPAAEEQELGGVELAGEMASTTLASDATSIDKTAVEDEDFDALMFITAEPVGME
ncbi:hypothetical protein N0V94_003694 [Neodidymelliopsis sp. IMI 364377]|nr:hypothetical protein N0V94_003694 [Neodidymelliopsis sp. IMI 364377]